MLLTLHRPSWTGLSGGVCTYLNCLSDQDDDFILKGYQALEYRHGALLISSSDSSVGQ